MRTFPILIILLIIICSRINAQDYHLQRFQINVGFGKALLYNSPVEIGDCSGCTTTVQQPKMAASFDFNYYYAVNPHSEFKVGFGCFFSKYYSHGYYGKLVNGEELSSISSNYTAAYLSSNIGHRLLIFKNKNLNPFFEYILNIDFAQTDVFSETQHLRTIVSSAKARIGLLSSIGKKKDLDVSLFYRNAIFRYNKETEPVKFMPYSFGIEFGISINK